MQSYRVTWLLDIEADSPQDAAEQALVIQRDESSIATVFTVTDVDGVEVDIALEGHAL
jgi:hypothetical protein